jgi:hypothetical protein
MGRADPPVPPFAQRAPGVPDEGSAVVFGLDDEVGGRGDVPSRTGSRVGYQNDHVPKECRRSWTNPRTASSADPSRDPAVVKGELQFAFQRHLNGRTPEAAF